MLEYPLRLPMDRCMKILYVCTHNRCRSILCEAISNARGAPLLEARSAGSDPAGAVHPLTLQHLELAGYPTAGLDSRSWGDLEGFDPDLVITVCDRAAGEACPLWLGRSRRLHWSLRDPSALQGTEAGIAAAFGRCIGLIERRVEALLQVARRPREEWPEALAECLERPALADGEG